jgi:hypothetical protein
MSPSRSPSITANRTNLLLGLLALAIAANLVMMMLFTGTVNRKFMEAIELSKPQEGTLTTITPEGCPQCRPLDAVLAAVKAQNVDLSKEQTVSAGSSEGSALIGKYAVTHLPALVFESAQRIKVPVRRGFEQNGRAVGEAAFVWEQITPPYYDVASGNITGLVEAMYLTDERCAECFNPIQVLQPMLLRFGIQPVSTKILDVSDREGKELVEQYAITKIPTVILSKEASAYASLLSTWQRLGTTEEDSSLVFRIMEAVRGTYKDLESGEIVEPPSPNR